MERVEVPQGVLWAVVRRGKPVAEGGRAVAVARHRSDAVLLAATLPALAGFAPDFSYPDEPPPASPIPTSTEAAEPVPGDTLMGGDHYRPPGFRRRTDRLFAVVE